MRSGLMPLSNADPAAVKAYLLGRQMPPEIIDWKYFDPGFNRDRERGVVWVRQNEVTGFLGLIPFGLEQGEVRANCAWSCDWSVDPRQGGGTGLLLVKRARELYDGIFNLGGNENTRRIFPRLADQTVPDAGISLVLPLRLGSIFARLPGPLKRLLSRQQILRRIPLRWVRARSEPNVIIEPGLSDRVVSVLRHVKRGEWRPLYDPEFFEWQFRRCPAITCWSCWITGEPPQQSAALLWRPQSSNGFWRFVLCGETTDLRKMKIVLGAMVSFVFAQGCVALFTIISRRESGLVNLLSARGFLRHGKLPLYIMRGRYTALPTNDFSVLNFLDADLGYRFEQEGISSET